MVPGRRATSHARKPCPFPFSPQAEKGRGQARGPRSWRRCCLSRLQVAALGSWPLRQLGRHSVLGSSLLFHVSRKSSWAVAGPGPGLLNLSPLPVRCWRRAAREGDQAAVQPLQSPQVRRPRGPYGPMGSFGALTALEAGAAAPWRRPWSLCPARGSRRGRGAPLDLHGGCLVPSPFLSPRPQPGLARLPPPEAQRSGWEAKLGVWTRLPEIPTTDSRGPTSWPPASLPPCWHLAAEQALPPQSADQSPSHALALFLHLGVSRLFTGQNDLRILPRKSARVFVLSMEEMPRARLNL